MRMSLVAAGFVAATLFAAGTAFAGAAQTSTAGGEAYAGCWFDAGAVTTAEASAGPTTAETKARIEALLDTALERTETASARPSSPVVFPPPKPGS